MKFRPHAIAALLTATIFGGVCSTASAQGSKEELGVIRLINQERQRRKLKPLQTNAICMRCAQAYAKRMAALRKVSHFLENTQPPARLTAAGYSGRICTENVAGGQKDAQETFKAWMDSGKHQANMLTTAANEIGVGMAASKDGTRYWIMIAAYRKNANVAVKPPKKGKANWVDRYTKNSGGPVFVQLVQLTNASPFDTKRKGCRAVTLQGVLRKDRTYTITLKSKTLDVFLRVVDSTGKEVAFNDDDGKSRNSEIKNFRPAATGTYYLIATTYARGKTGSAYMGLYSY